MPSDAWAAPLLQRRGGLYPGAAALAARLSFEAPSPDAEARESRSHGHGHHRWEVGEASLAEPSKRSENSTGASHETVGRLRILFSTLKRLLQNPPCCHRSGVRREENDRHVVLSPEEVPWPSTSSPVTETSPTCCPRASRTGCRRTTWPSSSWTP